MKAICSEIDVVYADIAMLQREKERVGSDDDEIKVVDAKLDGDDDDMETILDDVDLD